tara:strand:- start:571 stop:1296 length:726 start_codon:yes stop_codon:yes gene_type:complete
MNKCFAYIRTSTDKQEADRQRHVIEEYLTQNEQRCDEVSWYSDDGVSGSYHPDMRPGLRECIRDAKRAKGTIIVSDLERFSRTMWQTLQFWEETVKYGKVDFIVCNDPTISDDGMALQFKAMFSQMEREKIAERTKQMMRRIQFEIDNKGSYTTRQGTTITKLGNPDEIALAGARTVSAAVLSKKADDYAEHMRPLIEHMRARDLTYRQMADELNARGEKTRRGGMWHASTVGNIIKRLER